MAVNTLFLSRHIWWLVASLTLVGCGGGTSVSGNNSAGTTSLNSSSVSSSVSSSMTASEIASTSSVSSIPSNRFVLAADTGLEFRL